MPPPGAGCLALAAFLLAPAVLGGAEVRPLLRTVAEVRGLTRKAAELGYPVEIRGVITYSDSSHFLCFVQDATGGIYLSVRDPELAPGDLVEVKGVSGPGTVGRIITGVGEAGAGVKVLGRAPLPAPAVVQAEDLLGSDFDAQWISVAAEVRSVRVENGRAFLQLQCGAESIRAVLPGFHSQDVSPTYLQGLAVTVNGVLGIRVSADGARSSTYLAVPTLREIIPTEAAVASRFDLPVESFGEFFTIHTEGNTAQVRFIGKVTFAEPGIGFMMLVGTPEAWQGNTWVQTTQPDDVRAGMVVDVVGRPEWVHEFGSLKDALFRRVDADWPLSPRPVASLQELRRAHGELVQFRATLLETPFAGGNGVITLGGENKVVFARLPGELPADWKLPPAGSLVEVTGVYLERAMPLLGFPAPSNSAHVLLRERGDLRVVALPSWWTPPKVRGLVAVLVGAAGAALVWGVALRRQVNRQTRVIRRQLARETVHEERTRLARELHDTIEQNLVAVGIQLDAITRHLPAEMAQPRRLAEMAREMVGISRDEVREAVWELRSSGPAREELPGALKTRLALLAENSGLMLEYRTTGEPRRLSPEVERHLLRCALEAVTNALKHSHCTRLSVELEFLPEMVRLTVSDDGCGFDARSAGVASPGHFGFRGLQERVAKIGGTLGIESAPGEGTTVQIEVSDRSVVALQQELAAAS
jgi:signal transduction histidine kinase